MKDKIQFTVPAVPVAQPRHRTGKGRVYSAKRSHPVHAFKATARCASQEVYLGPPLEGPIRCDLVIVFPRTKSQIWKTKPMPRLLHYKKPDRDNVDKACLDALTGLLWIDDAQICDGRIQKFIAAGDEQPHVEITVTAMTEPEGIQ